jgi:hypothetical protein
VGASHGNLPHVKHFGNQLTSCWPLNNSCVTAIIGYHGNSVYRVVASIPVWVTVTSLAIWQPVWRLISRRVQCCLGLLKYVGSNSKAIIYLQLHVFTLRYPVQLQAVWCVNITCTETTVHTGISRFKITLGLEKDTGIIRERWIMIRIIKKVNSVEYNIIF